jgi:hypothetical protein
MIAPDQDYSPMTDLLEVARKVVSGRDATDRIRRFVDSETATTPADQDEPRCVLEVDRPHEKPIDHSPGGIPLGSN